MMNELDTRARAINDIKLNHLDEFRLDMDEVRKLRHGYKTSKKKADRERYKDNFFSLIRMMIKKYPLQQIDKGINTASIAYHVDEMFYFLENDVYNKIK